MGRVSDYASAILEPWLTLCDIVVRTTAQTGNLTVSRQLEKNFSVLLPLADIKC